MKTTLTALIVMTLGLSVQAANVGVYLDSTNGSSALVVYDAQTNSLMTVDSDGMVETTTNLTVNGTVSATSFTGDGSQLTGITTGENDPLWTNALQTGFSGNAISFTPQDGDDQNTLLIGNDSAEGFGGRLGIYEGGSAWHYITYSGGWLFDGNSFADEETDPVWAAEKSAYATGTPLYTFTEADPVWEAEKAAYATGTPLYTFSEADPVWEAEKAGYATGTPLYVEADPVFGGSTAADITSVLTGQWTEAYGWGDHADGGYADNDDLVSASNSLRSAITTETSARIGADAALSNEVSGITSDLATETTARTGADAALSNAVSTEASARIGADAALSNEVDGVASDLAAETTARIGADAALSNDVSDIASDLSAETTSREGADAALSNEVDGVASDLATETTARIGADAALSNDVSGIASDLATETTARIGGDAALSNEVSDIASDLSTEATARIGADAALSNEVDGVASDLAAETTARIGADAALSNEVSGIASDLATETTARTGADAALSNAVSTEASARIGADAALSNEVSGIASDLATETTARTGADAALSNEVDGVASDLTNETTARIGADTALSNEISAVASDLSTETTARAGADAALSNAVSTEATARIGADAALSNAISTVATDLNTASNAFNTAITNEVAARTAADTALGASIGAVASDLNTASNALQADIDTRLSSNFWATADSTTNYMPRSATFVAQLDNIIVVATNGTSGGAGTFDSPLDTPQNGYNAAAAKYSSVPATLLISAGSYPGLVAGAPNIHVTGISRPQLASLRITNTTASIIGKRRFEGLAVTGHVSVAGNGIKLDNMRINNGFSMTGDYFEVQNSFITAASAIPAFVVGGGSEWVAIYNSAIESGQSVATLVVEDNTDDFQLLGSQIINTAGALAIDDRQAATPTPLHFYAHNYIRSEGAATTAVNLGTLGFPIPPGLTVAFHNNTVWGDLSATGGGVGAQFSNNAIYGTNSWIQYGAATSDGYNNTHLSRSGVGTLPDSWED